MFNEQEKLKSVAQFSSESLKELKKISNPKIKKSSQDDNANIHMRDALKQYKKDLFPYHQKGGKAYIITELLLNKLRDYYCIELKPEFANNVKEKHEIFDGNATLMKSHSKKGDMFEAIMNDELEEHFDRSEIDIFFFTTAFGKGEEDCRRLTEHLNSHKKYLLSTLLATETLYIFLLRASTNEKLKGYGELLYQIYLIPETKSVNEILQELDLNLDKYKRQRVTAISLLSQLTFGISVKNVINSMELKRGSLEFPQTKRFEKVFWGNKGQYTLCQTKEEYAESFLKLLENTENAINLADSFHQPTGEGFKMMKTILKHYSSWKSMRLNENLVDDIREGERNSTLKDISFILGDNFYDDIKLLENVEAPNKRTLSQIEAYWAMNEAEEGTYAHDKLIHLITSKNSANTAAACQLLEIYVEYLCQNKNETFRKYGRIIKETYLTKYHQNIEEIKEHLGIKSNLIYHREKNRAITLLSQMLFGIDPGANGFVDIIIDDNNNLVFPEIN